MGDKPRLFGTDGVRGVAGTYPLDHDTVWKLGHALGEVLQKTITARPVRVVLGEDTRESSAWISGAIAAGLHSCGVEVVYASPGVPWDSELLVRARSLGIVVDGEFTGNV